MVKSISQLIELWLKLVCWYGNMACLEILFDHLKGASTRLPSSAWKPSDSVTRNLTWEYSHDISHFRL